MAINQMLLSALTGVGVPLYGDGMQRREFTYIDDVVEATLTAATVELTDSVINVGGGSSVTMLELLDLVHQVTGRPVPVFSAGEQAGDVFATAADLSKARDVLRYRPSISLREGLALQAEWLAGLPDSLRMPMLPSRLADVRR